MIEKYTKSKIDDYCLFASIVFFGLYILDWNLDNLFFALCLLATWASMKKRESK